MAARYSVGIVVIAVMIGLGSAVAIFAFTGIIPLGSVSLAQRSDSQNVLNDQVGNLTQKMSMLEQKLNDLDSIQNGLEKVQSNINSIQSNIDELQGGIEEQSSGFNSGMNTLKTQIRIVADQVDNLETKLDKLTIGASSLTAELTKSEYKAGDMLTITGTGLPNKPVKISLLGIDRLILSEGSTIADSNGVYTFSTQLSKSYAAGDYTIKFSQEGKVIERSFRIVGAETPSTQPPSSTTNGLTLQLDKSQYARGEKVLISGKTSPDTFVDLDLFDSGSAQLVRTATKSDLNGNFRLDYTLSSDARLGTYTVKVTSGDKQTSITFTVGSTSSPQTPSTPGSLTITTDKSDYNKGSLVKITGKAPANSKVTISVKPKSGDEILLTATATDTGNYITLLSIRSDASTGTWTLTAKEGSNSVTTQIMVI